MNYNAGTPLPSGTSDQTLADEFVHFFNYKVKKIRLSLDKSDFSDNTAPPDLDKPVPELGSFKVPTQEEFYKVIPRAVPVRPVQSMPFIQRFEEQLCFPCSALTITDVVNTPLFTGIFSDKLKHAVVTPYLKLNLKHLLLVNIDQSQISCLSAKSLSVLLHNSIIISSRICCMIIYSRHTSRYQQRQLSCKLGQTLTGSK